MGNILMRRVVETPKTFYYLCNKSMNRSDWIVLPYREYQKNKADTTYILSVVDPMVVTRFFVKGDQCQAVELSDDDHNIFSSLKSDCFTDTEDDVYFGFKEVKLLKSPFAVGELNLDTHIRVRVIDEPGVKDEERTLLYVQGYTPKDRIIDDPSLYYLIPSSSSSTIYQIESGYLEPVPKSQIVQREMVNVPTSNSVKNTTIIQHS